MRYKLLIFALIIIFFSGVFSNKSRPLEAPPSERTKPADRDYCSIMFPDATLCITHEDSPRHFQAFKQEAPGQKILLGYVLLTSDLAKDIKGYTGPIEMMIGVKPDGIINAVEIIRHNETSAYVRGLPSFIQQFIGMGFGDKMVLGEDVDALSRATVTSLGVTRAIKKSMAEISPIIRKKVTTPEPESGKKKLDEIYLPAILFIMAAVSILTRNKLLRTTSLLTGFVYLGLHKGSMFSVIHIINLGLDKLPPFSYALITYTLGGLTLLCLLLFGNLYCGYICPFAGLLEFLHFIAKKMKWPQCLPTKRLDLQSRFPKYLILFGIMIICFVSGKVDTANIETYVLLFSQSFSPITVCYLSFMLITSCFIYRFWCKYFCPIGAFNGLIARLSLLKIRQNKSLCTDCGICVDKCPTQALSLIDQKKITLNPSECITCGECLRACPHKALRFGNK